MGKDRIAADVTALVGKTPMIYLDRLANGLPGRVAAKLEFCNPTGSIKDRIVLNMIEDAERRGLLTPESVIIEPTSGNTGIGLACLCAVKGYRLILTMPDTMSHERRGMLKAFGAELVVTPGERGMRGAVEKAEELISEHKHSFMLQQFSNSSNPETHERTTGVEIWDDSGGRVSTFVAGVGTGGTITGVGRLLKRKNGDIRVVAVEPAEAAVLSGHESAGPHGIQGIGAGFVPDVLDREVIDDVITVADEDAAAMCRELARREGVFAGPSSGAAAVAALRLAEHRENEGKLIVAIFPDRGERYLSVGLFT